MQRMKSGLINMGLKMISVEEKLTFMFLKSKSSNIQPIVINTITEGMTAKVFAKLKQSGTYKKYGNIHNGTLNNVPVSVIRFEMGAPNASNLMEILHRTGKCKCVIRLDVCGTLTNKISIGSVVIPERALLGDGTSQYYLRKYADQLSDSAKENSGGHSVVNPLIHSIFKSSAESRTHTDCTIWTTDALFCEDPDEIAQWKDLGADTVDMETSIMYLLGELFELPTIAVMGVVDHPGSAEYDLIRSNKIHPELVTSLDRAFTAVLNALPSIEAQLAKKKSEKTN